MNSRKVLVVDDEKPISDIIQFNLGKEGYHIIAAYDGEEALQMVKTEQPDLVLLDVMLPRLDGFQVLRKIRESSQVPVIMLTAKEEEVDKVLGLELGADDYITKPFGMRELIARVKANLRRMEPAAGEGGHESVSGTQKLEAGELKIDFERYEVSKRAKVIELTLREFELLKFLATQDNQIFTREQLLKDVWGYEYFGDIRTVDVTVRRLREKVEDDSSNPKYILTKRGVGYYFKRF
ncbi:response regulator YycF [Acidaminobacter hydrogenoformans]|uniref:Stage 0 sporulation protein A homolog n=1 Tax=Acidaminobacter hydrogenoformans DSM 2784 TaxID=1120920 RepID=A0A1G5RT22_9FIRM|nr:response regulator YycF [Acidaminobacter hydrogenoformans]SCZ76591.1 two-component system, OmpR family, response regulator VicR [Acidaminobacter hydrogenoformans DSM 2784]